MNNTQFWNDKEIATQLKLSLSWVRKQRFLRRHGKEHVFTVDPVMIGSVPRYRHEDVQAWIEADSMPVRHSYTGFLGTFSDREYPFPY